MILFINACIRKESRTLKLAKVYLQGKQDIIEVDLQKVNLRPLNEQGLLKRNAFIENNNFNDEMFKYAKLFREADEIVIAAPYYDLSFPASLKVFIENITVNHITFGHDEHGVRIGLCKAKQLVYLTTAGSPIRQDYGYQYIKDLCTYMYGIDKVKLYQAEGLDVEGNNAEEILNETIQMILKDNG